jgi:hypothetical protein
MHTKTNINKNSNKWNMASLGGRHTCRQCRNTPLRCISVVRCLSVHLSVPAGRQARRSTRWAVVGFSLYSFAVYIWAIKRTRNQPIRWIATLGAGGRPAVDRSSRPGGLVPRRPYFRARRAAVLPAYALRRPASEPRRSAAACLWRPYVSL